MKVILLGELRGKGGEGDIVEVAQGFAENYLFPQGIAQPATPGNLSAELIILLQIVFSVAIAKVFLSITVAKLIQFIEIITKNMPIKPESLIRISGRQFSQTMNYDKKLYP